MVELNDNIITLETETGICTVQTDVLLPDNPITTMLIAALSGVAEASVLEALDIDEPIELEVLVDANGMIVIPEEDILDLVEDGTELGIAEDLLAFAEAADIDLEDMFDETEDVDDVDDIEEELEEVDDNDIEDVDDLDDDTDDEDEDTDDDNDDIDEEDDDIKGKDDDENDENDDL